MRRLTLVQLDPSPPRRGAVALIALIALLLASAVGTALLKTSLADHRVVQSQQDRLQADWLAESGLSRAAARLAREQDYQGETWTIAAGDLGEHASGTVVISVEAGTAGSSIRRVTAAAVYRRGETAQSRSTKTADVDAAGTEGTRN